jgi:hypothetical protein
MIKSVLNTLFSLSIFGLSAGSAVAEDNIAACEIVVQQPVQYPEEKQTDVEEKSEDTSEETNETVEEENAVTLIATFIPAEDFIASVFDEEPGHIDEINGQPIQALMCERRYMVPTEYDLRLIQTKIPLYLSQDFDSTKSDLMSVFFKDDTYQYVYSGAELDKDAMEIMYDRLFVLNSEKPEDEKEPK